jgi:hypothetical protein
MESLASARRRVRARREIGRADVGRGLSEGALSRKRFSLDRRRSSRKENSRASAKAGSRHVRALPKKSRCLTLEKGSRPPSRGAPEADGYTSELEKTPTTGAILAPPKPQPVSLGQNE